MHWIGRVLLLGKELRIYSLEIFSVTSAADNI